MRITKNNWDELLDNPPMRFDIFCNGAYCLAKTMKAENSFNQIRYLEPEMIITTIKKRISNQLNPESVKCKRDRAKWFKIVKAAEKLIEKTV